MDSNKRLRDRASRIIATIRHFLTGQKEGASLTEYAVLIGLIVLVCLTGMAALNGSLSTLFTHLASTFTGNGS
jgi:Flp pilus assembly pilin Flp